MDNGQQAEQLFAVCFDSFDCLIKNQRPTEESKHYKLNNFSKYLIQLYENIALSLYE